MLGDVVNLAARIMQSSRDEVRMDHATARAAAGRLAAIEAGLSTSVRRTSRSKARPSASPAFRVELPIGDAEAAEPVVTGHRPSPGSRVA